MIFCVFSLDPFCFILFPYKCTWESMLLVSNESCQLLNDGDVVLLFFPTGFSSSQFFRIFFFSVCVCCGPPRVAYSSATLSINVFSLTIYRSCALVMKGDVLGNHYVMMQLRRIIWSRCTVSNIYIKLPCYKPLFSLSLFLSQQQTGSQLVCAIYTEQQRNIAKGSSLGVLIWSTGPTAVLACTTFTYAV